MSAQPISINRREPDSLADVLERVLDKGVVIAGDIVVNVLDIELLTLKLRLFVASADTAREMGMDWWTRDPFFSSQAEPEQSQDARLERENDELRRQLAELRAEREELGAAGTSGHRAPGTAQQPVTQQPAAQQDTAQQAQRGDAQ